MIGLVLTAGGARGAYQAGVMKRLVELPAFADRPSPFPIVVGASAETSCTAPLRLEGIRGAIAEGHLFAVAIAATSYHSGRSFIFVFLNAIVLDHLDTDIDHLNRMNELIQSYQGRSDPRQGDAGPAALREPMRIVTPFTIGPSEDLALVAERCAHRMPRMLRHLLDGLGTPDAQSADLMSYLLFDDSYTRTLIDIGYRDASASMDDLEHFLRSDVATAAA